jgi:hypothetical protein
MSKRHPIHIEPLDQGNLGSCTFNATVHCVSAEPFWSTVNNQTLDEPLAVKGYSRATQLDNVPGVYPTNDTGSTGLAAAKAALELGLIAGYEHVFHGVAEVVGVLQERPCITGISWKDTFDDPDAEGIVRITSRSRTRGGHEIMVDEVDLQRGLIGFQNSWGPGWGLGGRFYLSGEDYQTLLDERGDVTVFTPRTSPAPLPVTDPVDAALVAAMLPWANQRYTWLPTGKAGRARAGLLAWMTARGYR